MRALRGGGDYTAAAICSAAWNVPCAVVDGNVYRVLARLFDLETPIDTAAGKRAFAELAQRLLDRERPGLYNQAIMDFGALQCTPAQPQCGACPFGVRCLARAAGSIAARPVKRGRTQTRDRWFNYLHVTCGERTVLCRRGAGDIWQGLYEFPMVETPAAAEFGDLIATEPFRRWVGPSWHLVRSVAMPRHQLSHQTLHAPFHRIEVPELPPDAAAAAVPTSALGEYAVPRLLDRYLTSCQM